ncbi:MAG TPA: AsmA-like C-terminal region-containing protein, partial [Candidatus Angelobacter sp.]|nr:AsmA-like C-terminal region-containing protein [Candidatus Angelobacter sp.]
RGEFSGTLDRLNIAGNTDTPQFEVTASGHRFHLTTQFRGSVDLKTGDVLLPAFQARFGNTNLIAQARVAGSPKTVALDVSQGTGQIQDLVLLFSNAQRSPVTGPIAFHTQTSLPPEHRPFKERVQLTGTFSSDPVKFTSANTQKNVDQLSERAEGKKDKAKDYDQDDDTDGFERVLTKLTGQVRLVNGIATFSRVSFSVPGAHARMNGTYSLLNTRINLHGDMRMEATVSQATTGKKSFFLKVLDPFFKKKHAGAQVPITMTGLYGQTHFGVGLK